MSERQRRAAAQSCPPLHPPPPRRPPSPATPDRRGLRSDPDGASAPATAPVRRLVEPWSPPGRGLDPPESERSLPRGPPRPPPPSPLLISSPRQPLHHPRVAERPSRCARRRRLECLPPANVAPVDCKGKQPRGLASQSTRAGTPRRVSARGRGGGGGGCRHPTRPAWVPRQGAARAVVPCRPARPTGQAAGDVSSSAVPLPLPRRRAGRRCSSRRGPPVTGPRGRQ